MYQVSVEAEFAAAHSLTIAGLPEPLHGHNFHVTVTLAGPTLGPDAMLCDFHAIADALDATLRPFRNATINLVPPFDTTSPSAELLARHIADQLARRLAGLLAPNVSIASVRVTEAPGCAATYLPPP